MNAVTQAVRPAARRIATLDPFMLPEDEATAGEAEPAPDAAYGCVDWYVYAHEPTADARVREARRLLIRRGGRDATPEGAQ
ncbi:MAG TPA: hypothetical protein VEG26_11580 [Steroidobacteraceae bacterium]|nr:hypothetical protein [Steroidobacteraceae bacterium]